MSLRPEPGAGLLILRDALEARSTVVEIQGVTDQAVSAIGGIAHRSREIDAVATSIAAAVEEQGTSTHEIVLNASQAAIGTSEVTGTIACVAQASKETGAAITQVLSAAPELSQQTLTYLRRDGAEHLFTPEGWRSLLLETDCACRASTVRLAFIDAAEAFRTCGHVVIP